MYEASKDKTVSIRGVLRYLKVSRSGYHSWKRRKEKGYISKQEKKKKEVIERIKELHEESHQIYGAPKITKKLEEEGVKITERTVGKYMKERGIKAHYSKPYTVTTTNSNFSNELKNILQREFRPENPNASWCSDITYIWTVDEGFVYLTSIMDLYSRKIIAWELAKDLKAEHVIKAIKKAKVKRKVSEALVLHSDRGVQYTCDDYQEETKGMKCSYSKKGTPYDNACIESFHAVIKREWLWRYKLYNYEEAYRSVFAYIEGFYNTTRIHSHCNYVSPNAYEKQYELKQTLSII